MSLPTIFPRPPDSMINFDAGADLLTLELSSQSSNYQFEIRRRFSLSFFLSLLSFFLCFLSFFFINHHSRASLRVDSLRMPGLIDVWLKGKEEDSSYIMGLIERSISLDLRDLDRGA
jgi:hypothetical protein